MSRRGGPTNAYVVVEPTTAVGRLFAQVWESAIAVSGIATSAAFAVAPNANPVHLIVEPWDVLWAVLYAVGSLLVLIGIASREGSNVEAAGLVMLTGGLLVQDVVFTTYLPLAPATVAGVVALSVLAVASVVRLVRVIAATIAPGPGDEPHVA